MSWLVAHWGQILTALGLAVLIAQRLATLANGLIAESTWSGRFRALVHWLANTTPPDKWGTYKWPFTSEMPAPLPPPLPPPPVSSSTPR